MNITGRLICLLFLVRVERRERHDGAAQPIGTTCGWGNVHPTTRRALFNFIKLYAPEIKFEIDVGKCRRASDGSGNNGTGAGVSLGSRINVDVEY